VAEFSPNGRFILTASANHTARVWDAATGQAVTPSLRHRDVIVRAEFSPDGRRVVTASWDATARVWDLPHDGRPVEDLMRLGNLLAGYRIDVTGGLEPLDTAAFRSAWEALRSKYPDQFNCSPEEILAWHRRQAEDFEEKRQWSEAATHLDVVVASGPGCWSDHFSDSWAHAELGHWEMARNGFSKVVQLGPPDVYVWRFLALARLGADDSDGYRDACASLLEQCAETGDRDTMAWTCVFRADAVADLSRPVELAEKAVAAEHFTGLRTLGAALYRAGRFDEAVGKVDESLESQGGRGPLDWLFLAMAHHRLGHTDDAHQWLDKAAEWIDEKRESGIYGAAPDWTERLERQLPRREAEALIGADRP
jgi:tetratricopeptide (TPR) repeat protein